MVVRRRSARAAYVDQGGRLSDGGPHRQRAFAHEHRHGFDSLPPIESIRIVYRTADDSGAKTRVVGIRIYFETQYDARSIRPQLVRKGSNLAPEAVPRGACPGAIAVDATRRARAVLAPDPGRLVESFHLEHLAAGGTGAATTTRDKRL